MGQRFRRVIAQPRGDRNPRVTVDHKGVVRVIDDCGKFHLENSVELIDDGIDVKLESPCHRGSPSPWPYSGSVVATILSGFDRLATSERVRRSLRSPRARAAGQRPRWSWKIE